jgi:RNA recognition motif-containing protein
MNPALAGFFICALVRQAGPTRLNRRTAVKKLFVGNLPSRTTDEDLKNLFSTYGTVRSFKLVTDVFSGQCKGFGFVEMEGHEARAAIAALNGKDYNGKPMKVNFESPNGGRRRR